jgi:hypothetical protein
MVCMPTFDKRQLTERLVEWFTLMNKDKFAGKVYLELTFWSNVRLEGFPSPRTNFMVRNLPQKRRLYRWCRKATWSIVARAPSSPPMTSARYLALMVVPRGPRPQVFMIIPVVNLIRFHLLFERPILWPNWISTDRLMSRNIGVEFPHSAL